GVSGESTNNNRTSGDEPEGDYWAEDFQIENLALAALTFVVGDVQRAITAVDGPAPRGAPRQRAFEVPCGVGTKRGDVDPSAESPLLSKTGVAAQSGEAIDEAELPLRARRLVALDLRLHADVTRTENHVCISHVVGRAARGHQSVESESLDDQRLYVRARIGLPEYRPACRHICFQTHVEHITAKPQSVAPRLDVSDQREIQILDDVVDRRLHVLRRDPAERD